MRPMRSSRSCSPSQWLSRQASHSRMSLMAQLPSAAFGDPSGRGLLPKRPTGRAWRRFWLSLTAGFLAGAGVALDLAQADRAGSGAATPPYHRAAPPTPANERPYVQPIGIGMGPDYPISGVRAPSRGSAAFWRDGEVSRTAAAFLL